MKAKTLREIRKFVGRAYSSIQRVISNYNSSKSVLSKLRNGRQPKLFKSVHLNLEITASRIANDVRERSQKTLYEDTIRKILKKADYNGRVARRKLQISHINN
ncbi:hypothetical protein AVEN_44545-1 [Araneus ventricosus]|uniref:Transposase Tc1-like domain-containing protein n=1 Tax=Araneus ventricosus TaxID=182803 RepID=A0A4Y2NPP2_ARAVE|nr:hypothetical protein AVEN_101990-1 [Araneus ventricosus]GBN40755.1 hypothetical protein AVEN_231797-1 [Araneus ventricosus]GBN40779.1 hypothetical protein AVEN_268059-1 [Araneus ventricosus]GBN40812.1 hypothetical protein AVEN_44545-1 [Araneus ventricosus]